MEDICRGLALGDDFSLLRPLRELHPHRLLRGESQGEHMPSSLGASVLALGEAGGGGNQSGVGEDERDNSEMAPESAPESNTFETSSD
jgi:hypothetical protein